MTKTLFFAALGSAMIVSTSAFSAGSEDPPATPVCEAGYYYDDTHRKCKPSAEQSLNDQELLNNAIALAYAGRFEEAMGALNSMTETETAEVQNYFGYVTRNLGDVETGLAHYRHALTLDPDYTLARSYMGQALLLSGDRRGAMVQLDEIASREGTSTRAYTELAQALLAKSLQQDFSY